MRIVYIGNIAHMLTNGTGVFGYVYTYTTNQMYIWYSLESTELECKTQFFFPLDSSIWICVALNRHWVIFRLQLSCRLLIAEIAVLRMSESRCRTEWASAAHIWVLYLYALIKHFGFWTSQILYCYLFSSFILLVVCSSWINYWKMKSRAWKLWFFFPKIILYLYDPKETLFIWSLASNYFCNGYYAIDTIFILKSLTVEMELFTCIFFLYQIFCISSIFHKKLNHYNYEESFSET